MAFFADVLLASHAILPFLVGRGTCDEALRKSAWKAMGDSSGKASRIFCALSYGSKYLTFEDYYNERYI